MWGCRCSDVKAQRGPEFWKCVAEETMRLLVRLRVKLRVKLRETLCEGKRCHGCKGIIHKVCEVGSIIGLSNITECRSWS